MTLVGAYDVLLLDLDGVVYRGLGAVPHAVEALSQATAQGARLGFVTNNASRPAAEVAAHLTDLGVVTQQDQVVTSAHVGAALLQAKLAPGSRVLAVGGPGVPLALERSGFQVVDTATERSQGHSDAEIAASVAGVLQGFGPDVTWRDLAVASYAVARGAFWVATNTDRTIPRAAGLAPGNGTFVSAVTAATGIEPPVAGKPAPDMMRIAAERLGASRALVIGDRLDTDIRGGRAAGDDTLLVLSGVSSVRDLLEAEPLNRPTYISPDLRGLLQDLPRLDAASTDQAASLIVSCWQDSGIDRAAAADRITALLGA